MNKSKVKHLLSTGLLKISDVLEIVDALNMGGCAIIPTDTGYLIACDATNDVAIQNVFNIKKRKNNNPIHVCVGSVNQAYKVGKFTVKAKRLLDTYCPGAISIIVPKQEWVSDLLIANTGNIGIRIPDEPCILQICNELDKPITATSVNFAEQPPLSNFSEILNLFESNVDYLVESNKDTFLESSTVVRIIKDKIEILRKGPIPDSSIFETANNTTTYSDCREWT
ncbi:MAG: threonylcarbamoyl-AMP synthase [Dysgonamonadaceae bacterium]|jgi:L-threonylcarbamoyladenylate synthase|nr:threonylcarbamoyl-AMP synthase [Dysgonamonadaceae bacterium]